MKFATRLRRLLFLTSFLRSFLRLSIVNIEDKNNVTFFCDGRWNPEGQWLCSARQRNQGGQRSTANCRSGTRDQGIAARVQDGITVCPAEWMGIQAHGFTCSMPHVSYTEELLDGIQESISMGIRGCLHLKPYRFEQ